MFQNLRRVLLSKHMLLLMIAVLGIFACRCTPIVDVYCISRYDTTEAAVDCVTRYTHYCPETLAVADLRECGEAFEVADTNGTLDEPFEPSSGAAPTPNPQTNAVIAPTDCSAFRLTSPLDGLPNGTTTFYWDPLPEATGYQISIFDGGTHLATWNAPAGATNLVADVSAGAIGGGYNLVVQATAFTDGTPCFSQAGLGREAGANHNTDNTDNGGGSSEPAAQPTEPPAEPTPCFSNECIR